MNRPMRMCDHFLQEGGRFFLGVRLILIKYGDKTHGRLVDRFIAAKNDSIQ